MKGHIPLLQFPVPFPFSVASAVAAHAWVEDISHCDVFAFIWSSTAPGLEGYVGSSDRHHEERRSLFLH